MGSQKVAALYWSKIRDQIISESLNHGFAEAGIASARPFTTSQHRLLDAHAKGRLDGMPWMTEQRIIASAHLNDRYPWMRSILALAWPYAPAPITSDNTAQATEPLASSSLRGRISSYACIPEDYHSILARKCDALTDSLSVRFPTLRLKRFIDHGWAIDRSIAERAGIGFIGKHASLITRSAGSYVLLAEIGLSLPLPPTQPSRKSCHTCRACLPACPTNAIIAPKTIDATRCISYLTIEHKGSIPIALRPLIGSWIFGCDLCQEACPINSRLAPKALSQSDMLHTTGAVPFPDLIEYLALSDQEFKLRFKTTALWRTGRNGLARNAAIALGNSGNTAALPSLKKALTSDPDPTVREAAQWAYDQILTRKSKDT